MIPAITVTTNSNVVLNTAAVSTAGKWIVGVVNTGGTFSIKPQKRVHPYSGDTGQAFADCWYTLALTNATVVAGITQTANTILDIDASGCDVQLVVTVAGGASVAIHATPLSNL